MADRFPIPERPKLRFAAGFMCQIAYDHELGATDCVIYPTLKALREAHPCWAECGVVQVGVEILEVISEGTM